MPSPRRFSLVATVACVTVLFSSATVLLAFHDPITDRQTPKVIGYQQGCRLI